MRSIAAVLALALLLVQSAELTHSHDGDLEHQADCEICLKFGSDEETTESNADLPLNVDPQTQLYSYQSLTLETSPLSLQARAPPAV